MCLDKPHRPASKAPQRKKSPEDNNPLSKRVFEVQNASSNALQLKWSHGHYPGVKVLYKLECGIGHKINGIEQFKNVYQGEQPSFTLLNLQSKYFTLIDVELHIN